MKCVACGAEHSDRKCPVCRFPVVSVPGDVSEQEFRQLLCPQLEKHRKEKILPNLKIGVVLLQYDVHETGDVEEREERVFFENIVSGAFGKEPVWLKRKLDTASERDMVETEIFAEIFGCSSVRSQRVRVPQIVSSEEQKLGIRLDEELRFSLCVQGENGSTRVSEWYPLFL